MLYKTYMPKLVEVHQYLGIFMIINNIPVFENYEVIVSFFRKNMEL